MPSGEQYTSVAIVILAIILVGLYSTRLVKSSSDFIVGGRKLGAAMVCGGIVGAFAGGTVTVGTAQMAYRYGASGLWFTLGAGAACLIISLFLAGPLREKGAETISQYLSGFYGRGVAPWAALFIALGMYIQLAVQMLASVPLLTSLLPVSPWGALALFAFFSLLLILGGGFMSATLVGFFKLLLMTVTFFAAGAMSWGLLGGLDGLGQKLPDFPWLSMFPRGVLADLAGGISVVVGFISTQSFIQPVFAGKDARAARAGSLLAAVILPCFGMAGVLVGMYMRTAHPGIDPASALPLFMLAHQPAWLGGVGLATIFVSLSLTASALALGVSTLLSRDILPLIRPASGDQGQLLAARLIILVVVATDCVFSYSILGDMILDWTYLSNALRGVTVFLPLVGAVFFSRRLWAGVGIWAVAVPPLVSIAWAILNPAGFHPLYAGLPVSLLIMAAGMLLPGRQASREGRKPGMIR